VSDLRIVRGNATEEEVAAVVAALTVVSRRAKPASRVRSRWADKAALLRQVPRR
jgi:hypothetical protein